MSFALSPTSNSILSFISFAALFVNVIANIFHGNTFFSCNKYAILCVNTFVFPLPAPAITRHGPSVFTTASYCLSFNPFNISSIIFSFLISIKLNGYFFEYPFELYYILFFFTRLFFRKFLNIIIFNYMIFFKKFFNICAFNLL